MAASLVLSCAQPCQCILSQPVANRRTKSTNVHTELTMGTILRCSQCIIFYFFRVLATSLVQKCRTSAVRSTCLTIKIELSLQSHTLFVDIEARARHNTNLTFSWKNREFHARACLHPWIHTLPDSITSQLLDIGVDMMMWLTWWCECWPWPSSITWKFAN